jgi:hypothetical protein
VLTLLTTFLIYQYSLLQGSPLTNASSKGGNRKEPMLATLALISGRCALASDFLPGTKHNNHTPNRKSDIAAMEIFRGTMSKHQPPRDTHVWGSPAILEPKLTGLPADSQSASYVAPPTPHVSSSASYVAPPTPHVSSDPPREQHVPSVTPREPPSKSIPCLSIHKEHQVMVLKYVKCKRLVSHQVLAQERLLVYQATCHGMVSNVAVVCKGVRRYEPTDGSEARPALLCLRAS